MEELRQLIRRHVRPDLRTILGGLVLSSTTSSEPHHSMSEPLLVVMAQGGKRLLLGDRVFEYRAGQILVVAADLPLAGHFIDATPRTPALAAGLILRPALVAELSVAAPSASAPLLATGDATPEIVDAMVRMARLLDVPSDAEVLAPLIEREIVWRLLTGPHGDVVRRIGLSSGGGSVHTAIDWIRHHYAEPMRIDDIARRAGLSPSAFHRQFRTATALSPLQFQKRVRLQSARSLLVVRPDDVAGVGHQVGYDSPSQFSREYRRLFGVPPGRDAERLRRTVGGTAPALP